VSFNWEEMYKEAGNCMKWEKGTEEDEEIKKSLQTYEKLNAPSGDTIFDWLLWNTKKQAEEYKKRIQNGENVDEVVADFRDIKKNKFYYEENII